MCVRCLDEWDEAGQSYADKRVTTTVVSKGDSLCPKHYREQRTALRAPKNVRRASESTHALET